MKDTNKVIVLDMDETLLTHQYKEELDENGDDLIMILRPHLDKLIEKLREVKKKNVDIILCTTAMNIWVQRFLNFKPEMRELIDKIYMRENKEEWNNYDIEIYKNEYESHEYPTSGNGGKPVTTFGYDSILFIDDNKFEKGNLSRLFETAKRNIKKRCNVFYRISFIFARWTRNV